MKHALIILLVTLTAIGALAFQTGVESGGTPRLASILLTASKALVLDANKKICGDGPTCAFGFYHDGTQWIIQSGLSVDSYGKVPYVGDVATPQQMILHGTKALIGGTASVDFATPFDSVPTCICSNRQAALALYCVATITTLSIETPLESTEEIDWLCIGDAP